MTVLYLLVSNYLFAFNEELVKIYFYLKIKLNYIGSKYLPKFETTAEGFTSLKMVSRTDTKEKEPSPLTAQTQSTKKYTWDQSQFDFTQNAKEAFEIGMFEYSPQKSIHL